MSDEGSGADMSAADRYRAPALDKGFDILEVLASHIGGLTRAEIGRELGLSASQLYRMLERLVARGYVARVEGGDRYTLSMKMFVLATRHPPFRRLTAQAQPMLDDFAAEMKQSCHLVVPDHGAGLIIAQASPISHWEYRARVGAQMDLFSTGSGLTLLACQHPDRSAETLGQWGIVGAEDRSRQVAPELRAIRAAGYRMAPSMQIVGVTDISVPIRGPDQDAVAVVTCAHLEHPDAPKQDLHGGILEKLKSLADALSLPILPGR